MDGTVGPEDPGTPKTPAPPATGEGAPDQAGWAAAPGQGPWSGPPPPTPPPTKSRKSNRVAASVVAIVVVIGVRFGIEALFGEATKPGGLVNKTIVSEDFSDPSSGWYTVSDATRIIKYAGGKYDIRLLTKGDEIESVKYLPSGKWGAMSVEATAQPVGSAKGAFGIGCVMSTDTGSGSQLVSGTMYVFLVSPSNGKYVIAKGASGGSSASLKQGSLPSGALPGAGPNDLKAACSTSGGTSTSLMFFLNGKQVATVADPSGPGGFNGIALVVFSLEAKAEVTFDNAVMKRI